MFSYISEGIGYGIWWVGVGSVFFLACLFFWVYFFCFDIFDVGTFLKYLEIFSCLYLRVKHQKSDWKFGEQEELVDKMWWVEVAWSSTSWKWVVCFIRRPPYMLESVCLFSLRLYFLQRCCGSSTSTKSVACVGRNMLLFLCQPMYFPILYPKLRN